MTAKILPFQRKTTESQLPLYDKVRVEELYNEISLLDQYLKYVEENHIHDIDLNQYEDWVKQNHPELR